MLSLVVLATLAAPPGEAGDLTAFLSKADPGETWETGFGGAVNVSLLGILNLEGEGAYQPGDLPESDMLSFTGSVLISPPIGSLIPYGGLGLGAYRQTAGGQSDTGTLSALVLGLRLKLGGMLVVKGEYRKYDLPDDALLPCDQRFSVGAGITF